jgi:wobble nucleotide-excising tRNase
LENGVNGYLDRFNAGFRIGSLTPANLGRGTGSTCTYNVLINNAPIAVRGNTNTPGEPSFRNSLSAGDRNTLALALFFSSLDRLPNLADTVVVIDDPMSSLDDHRSLATVQKVRALSRQAKQTIVLSHNKRFLCGILNGVNRHEECTTLEIAPNGDESTIRTWNASQVSITEHDQRYFLLSAYAADQSGVDREVAESIRFYLEGYFRVACPGPFPPGKLLGRFAYECRQRIGRSDEVLDEKTVEELESILEYANRFHHPANPAMQGEHIPPTELLGYVRRTLALARPPAFG